MKKVIYYLQLLDGIWTVPLGFFIFFFVGLTLSSAFGMAVGQYDMAFIQPLFLAGTIVVGATNMAVWGLFFTFKGLYRYLYGYVSETGLTVNDSKNDFSKLQPIQKICVALFSFCFFVVCILVVYLNLV